MKKLKKWFKLFIIKTIKQELTAQLLQIYTDELTDFIFHKFGAEYLYTNFWKSNHKVIDILGDSESSITVLLADQEYKIIDKYSGNIDYRPGAELTHWHSNDIYKKFGTLESDLKEMKYKITAFYADIKEHNNERSE